MDKRKKDINKWGVGGSQSWNSKIDRHKYGAQEYWLLALIITIIIIINEIIIYISEPAGNYYCKIMLENWGVCAPA